MKLYFLGACSLLLCLWSCKPTTQTTPPTAKKTIFENYYIRYTETENALHADMALLTGDSLAAARAYAVTAAYYQEKPLTSVTLPNGVVQYSLDVLSALKKDHVFRYNVNNTQQQSYTASVMPLDSVYVGKKRSLREGIDLHVGTQQPLAANENLTLMLQDAKGNPATIVIADVKNDGMVTISPDDIKHLSAGKATLEVIKRQIRKETKDDRQIQFVFEYYVPTLTINLAK